MEKKHRPLLVKDDTHLLNRVQLVEESCGLVPQTGLIMKPKSCCDVFTHNAHLNTDVAQLQSDKKLPLERVGSLNSDEL